MSGVGWMHPRLMTDYETLVECIASAMKHLPEPKC